MGTGVSYLIWTYQLYFIYLLLYLTLITIQNKIKQRKKEKKKKRKKQRKKETRHFHFQIANEKNEIVIFGLYHLFLLKERLSHIRTLLNETFLCEWVMSEWVSEWVTSCERKKQRNKQRTKEPKKTFAPFKLLLR